MTRRWMRRLTASGLVAVVLAATACTGEGGDPATDPDGQDPTATPTGDGDGEAVDGRASAPLSVRLREVGPAGQVPAQLTARTNKPQFADHIGQAPPEGVSLSLTPEVPGTLTVTSADTVTFTPSGAGFAPGTAYTATLTVEDGVADERRFQTPPLTLLRAKTHARGVEDEASRLELALVFSAPVDAEAAIKRASFSVKGQPLRPVAVSAGDRPTEARARFVIPADWDEEIVEVSLSAGVPWAGGGAAKAPAGRAEAPVRLGPPVEILSTRVKEGVSGFYIDVICRDEALGEDSERYFWDEDTWDGWWVTERCMLSEQQVAEMVRLSPAVDLTVAPAAGGFRLFGDLSRGEYTLEIDAGARTVDGGVLAQAHSARLRVPGRSPSVQLAAQGRYLPRDAWDELAVRHMNVSELELTVRHIPQQNLAFWLSGDSEAATARTAETVLQERITVPQPQDEEHTSFIDVGALIPSPEQGVYELLLSGADGQARDAARLLLTDLQLVAKRGLDAEGEPEVTAWLLDARNGAPVQGATLKVIRPSGQEAARCTTPLTGSCVLPMPADPIDEAAAPMAIVATSGEDLTYLRFSDLEVRPEGDVMGEAFRAEAPYRAAVLTERGVYRPGETVRLTSIVREADHTAPDGGLPVVLKIYDPRNRELRRVATTTNAAGMISEDLSLTDFATTGRYRAELVAGERTLGAATFDVEEFVPERMAVETTAPERGVRADDLAPVSVSARWLFGGSAADSRVELTCTAEAGAFTPPKNRAYHYGPASVEGNRPRPVTIGVIEGVLDADGEASLSCPPAATSGASLAAGKLVARAAVFEGQSGRSTVSAASAPLHPADFYIGMRASADTLSAGEKTTVDGLLVDWDGEVLAKAPGEVLEVEIFHLEEEIGWLWDESTGSSVRRRQLRRVRDGEQEVRVEGGKFKLPFTPSVDAAGYLLIARMGEAETALHIEGEGRRYWWAGDEQAVDQTPRPERPVPLELTLPEAASVGEMVKVTATAPYRGRVLWTVETDRVLHSTWADVAAAGEIAWAFPIDRFTPNVYVSALVVKDPHLESSQAYLPGRAYGVRSLTVRPEAHQHAVSIDVPAEVRPNSPLPVTVKVDNAEGPTWAVVAAVDEGILQLTDFDSPDPTDALFAQRALGVETFETIGWSLADGGGSRTGGDAEGAAGGGRVQMVKPVALWSGLVEVGADGTAQVELDVPGYRGELRVMAVTADASRVGSADEAVTVRDPLVLQTTLPRFLVEGDMAIVPVSVTNMTGKEQDITVRLSAEELKRAAPFPGEDGLGAPVAVLGEASQQIRLAPGEDGTVPFRVRAERAFTAARLSVVAEGGGERSTETLEIPLTSARSPERKSQRVALAPGSAAAVDLERYLTGWAPGSDRSVVWLTANPYGQSFSHLRYLIRYPYGCIEQTTSSTRPLLYTRSLLEATGAGVSGDEVDAMIQSGIERVAGMQTPEGGFAYWPGGTSPYLWATAYATHMLLDARDAGVALPTGLVERAVVWMDGQVGSSGDAHGAAYAHYVLARAGKPRTAEALRRFEQLSDSDKESRVLLMAAVQQAGDRRFEEALKRPDLTPIDPERENSWRFYSDRRRRAMTLNLMEELFPGAEGNVGLADLVADSVDDRDSRWYTTQELAWAVSGLGKRVAGLNASLRAPELTQGGAHVAVSSADNQGVVWRLGPESRLGDLALAPPGGQQALYLHINTDGVRAAEPEAFGGEGLTLSRTWLNGQGQPITLDEISLGELLYVRVSIRNDRKQTVQNIALVDRVPAGLEIENPRLGRGALPDWAEDLDMWEREHMNLRDERLEVFGTLRAGQERSVVYAVRAVTAGEFTQPPVSAEAMYDPTVWARQPGSPITIVGPWGSSM